jgi:hypothetical protein
MVNSITPEDYRISLEISAYIVSRKHRKTTVVDIASFIYGSAAFRHCEQVVKIARRHGVCLPHQTSLDMDPATGAKVPYYGK